MSHITYCQTFFVNGGVGAKNKSFSRSRFEVKDPPCNGSSRAFFIRPDPEPEGQKRKRQATVTIFSPFNLEAYVVSENAAEVRYAHAVDLDTTRVVAIIKRSWETCQKYGFQRAYDVAALVLTDLGQEVPTKLEAVGARAEQQNKKKGGKPVNEEKLSSVKPGGKRAQVAEAFDNPEPVSMLEIMARLGMSRNTVLTHLHRLHTEHGVGYEVIGDCARLVYPEKHQLVAQKG